MELRSWTCVLRSNNFMPTCENKWSLFLYFSLIFMDSFKPSKANTDACTDVGSSLQGLEPSM
jgi:hypothetical protein